MKITFYIISLFIIIHSVIFGILKFNFIEYFTLFGLDIYFNHVGWMKDLLIYKYKIIVLYVSYFMIVFILFLIYKNIFSKIILIILLLLSIFNITVVEKTVNNPMGYVSKTILIVKYEIWKIFYGSKTITENGIKKTEDDDGNLISEIPIKSGAQKTFYKSGKLESEVKIIDGKKEGEENKYYENGILMAKSMYKDGLLEGIHKSYYQDGKIYGTFLYKDGKQISYKLYYENGNIMDEGTKIIP